MKKRIKCRFLCPETCIRTLVEEKFEIDDDAEPDFVICGCGQLAEVLQYDCVRILYIGENIRPDFNYFDYAWSFDKIQFGDRSLYYPLYVFPDYRPRLETAMQKHLRSEAYFLGKEKFCNIVVTNVNSSSDVRYRFFQELDRYSHVDSGGRAFNNLADGKNVEDKRSFQEQYRFTIAFENSSYPGYATEKIIDAWAAGTIPIYWGDPTIGEQFNEEAFVNCHRYADFTEVVQAVREINEDRSRYLAMQQAPILKDPNPLEEILRPEYFRDWLFGILDQDPQAAIRRTNAHDGWGYYMERDAKRHAEMDESKLVRVAYKLSRMLRR